MVVDCFFENHFFSFENGFVIVLADFFIKYWKWYRHPWKQLGSSMTGRWESDSRFSGVMGTKLMRWLIWRVVEVVDAKGTDVVVVLGVGTERDLFMEMVVVGG